LVRFTTFVATLPSFSKSDSKNMDL
jgi:hypothetical protein